MLLGPAEAKVGDHVFVVGGVITPLILRQNRENYTLVGDSYVHGLSEGLTSAEMTWHIKKLLIC
jgi:hypothetical protein